MWHPAEKVRNAVLSIARSPDSTNDRALYLAAIVLQVTLVVLGFLVGTLVITFHVIPALGDSWPSRALLASIIGTAYALCYLAVTRIDGKTPAAWSSVAMVVLELMMLAILLPYLVGLSAALAPPFIVQRLGSGDAEGIELAFLLALLLFCIKGWARHIRGSARARVAMETAAVCERLAHEDVLTGLPNRRRFERRMVLRDWRRLHLLMIDVDRFKRINDDHSHNVGDEVLRRIGEILRSGIRSNDFAARLAGDEFVVALFDLDDAAAQATATRLKQAVLSHSWGEVAPGLAVSISVGVTAAAEGAALVDVIRHSDSAMYQDKALGRSAG